MPYRCEHSPAPPKTSKIRYSNTRKLSKHSNTIQHWQDLNISASALSVNRSRAGFPSGATVHKLTTAAGPRSAAAQTALQARREKTSACSTRGADTGLRFWGVFEPSPRRRFCFPAAPKGRRGRLDTYRRELCRETTREANSGLRFWGFFEPSLQRRIYFPAALKGRQGRIDTCGRGSLCSENIRAWSTHAADMGLQLWCIFEGCIDYRIELKGSS